MRFEKFCDVFMFAPGCLSGLRSRATGEEAGIWTPTAHAASPPQIHSPNILNFCLLKMVLENFMFFLSSSVKISTIISDVLCCVSFKNRYGKKMISSSVQNTYNQAGCPVCPPLSKAEKDAGMFCLSVKSQNDKDACSVFLSLPKKDTHEDICLVFLSKIA